MKSVYKRENFLITEFDKEDVITTSGIQPTEPSIEPLKREKENAYGTFNSFESSLPGSWFS